MKPTVSCVCVTQNRRLFLRRAVEYFWRSARDFEQVTGCHAELVIVDGSPKPHPDIGPLLFGKVSDFHYAHEPSKVHSRTGYFHNRAVELSQGEFIIAWDDDDWHAPNRIFKQYLALLESKGPSFTFTSKFYHYHLVDQLASLSHPWYAGKNSGSLGAMFAYHRAAWEKIPFRDVPQGEDNWLWDDFKKGGITFLDTQDPTFCIYLRHHQNGSPLAPNRPDPQVTMLARRLLDEAGDLAFYDELSEFLPLASWGHLRSHATPYGRHRLEAMRDAQRRGR